MEADQYLQLTKKREHKNKLRYTPLPKAKQNYLEAYETLKEELTDHAIGFESKFQPIHTKHWRFDFHIVKLRLLIEIDGGPWSGGRKGKLAFKAWSLDKYDQVWEKGYTVARIESSSRYKIDESGPTQIDASHADQWLKSLKRQKFNEPDKTISTD